MTLEEKYIKEFKEAYEKDFGELLTEQQASEKFFRLVRLVRTVLYGAPNNYPEVPAPGSPLVDESNSDDNLKNQSI